MNLSSGTPLAVGLLITALLTGCGTPTDNIAPAESNEDSQRDAPVCELPNLTGQSESSQRALEKLWQELSEKSGPEATEAAGRFGATLFSAGLFDAAGGCLAIAAESEPGGDWEYLLAHDEMARGNSSQGKEHFRAVIEARPDHAAANIWLGKILSEEADYAGARARYSRAMELLPYSASAAAGLGEIELAERNYSQAITLLEQALELSPSSSRLHYPLALAYRGAGDEKQAEHHLGLRGARDIFPADPVLEGARGLLAEGSTTLRRGGAAYGAGKFEEAVQIFEAELERTPKRALIWSNLGSCWLQLADLDKAETSFRKAIEFMAPDGSFAEAHYGLGLVSEIRGQDPAAFDHYSAALAIAPTYVLARYRIAEMQRRKGEFAEASLSYGGILKLDARHAESLWARALINIQNRNDAQALSLLGEANAILPEQSAFRLARARLLAGSLDREVHNPNGALQLLDPMMSGPKTLELALTVAMALAANGDFDRAIEWQVASIEQISADAAKLAWAEANLERYRSGERAISPWAPADKLFEVVRTGTPPQPRSTEAGLS